MKLDGDVRSKLLFDTETFGRHEWYPDLSGIPLTRVARDP
jgi:hypothetical protein